MREEPRRTKEKTMEEWKEEFKENVTQTELLADFAYGRKNIDRFDLSKQTDATKNLKSLCDQILSKIGIDI